MSELEKYKTPPDLIEAAKIASHNLFPDKSRKVYISVYDKFIKWQEMKKTTSFSENVMLAYFNELSEKYKASSLWAQYSMLKSTLITNQNVNIKAYSKLIAFLKKQSVGFKSKKSKVLTSQNIEKYLNEAPDNKHLATKVALIFGIMGCCRKTELTSIRVQDIENIGSMYLVQIPVTKTYIARSFTITDKFYHVVEKYYSLRPKNCKCDRFFLNYQHGKCTQQPIGINKFSNMPKEVATYLNLENPEAYTSHSFRRTSATLPAESGANITSLKRHGGWKSVNIAEGYIEQSMENKKKICGQIGQSIDLKNQIPSSTEENKFVDENDDDEPPIKISKNPEKNINHSSLIQSQSENLSFTKQNFDVSSKINIPRKNLNLTIKNCTNITFHFHEK